MKPTTPESNPSRRWPSRLAAATAAAFAAPLLGTGPTAQAASAPLVDVKLTGQAYGDVTSIPNAGSLGGNFAVVSYVTDPLIAVTAPSIAVVGTGVNRKTGIQFNQTGTSLLLMDGSGAAIYSPDSILGVPDPDTGHGRAVYTIIATVFRNGGPLEPSQDACVVSFAPWSYWGNLFYGNCEVANHGDSGESVYFANGVNIDAPAGSWHTLLLTSDGTDERLYIDGNSTPNTIAGGPTCFLNIDGDYPIRLGGSGYWDLDSYPVSYSEWLYNGAIGSLQIWAEPTAPENVAARTAAVAPILIVSYLVWTLNYPGATLTDPAADYDHDGMSNQQEYAFGLDPTKGSSVSPIKVLLDKTAGTFSYTRTAYSTLTYTVETSTDLQTWSPAAAAQTAGTPDSNGVATVNVQLTGYTAPSGGKLFVRVKAE